MCIRDRTNLSLAPSGQIAEWVAGAYLGEGVLRLTPLDPLPFTTRYAPPPPERLEAYAGSYAGKNADVDVRVEDVLVIKVTTRETGNSEEFPVTAIGPDVFMARQGDWAATPVYFRQGEGGSFQRIISGGSLFERVPGNN